MAYGKTLELRDIVPLVTWLVEHPSTPPTPRVAGFRGGNKVRDRQKLDRKRKIAKASRKRNRRLH